LSIFEFESGFRPSLAERIQEQSHGFGKRRLGLIMVSGFVGSHPGVTQFNDLCLDLLAHGHVF
jgi:hypothetical protein